MNRLLKIAQSATPGADVQFRREPYGKRDIRRFLRDVIAMANAAVEGPRYIVIGAEFDARGKKRLHSVDLDDFAGKPTYPALATDFIEPPIRLQYRPVTVDGKRLGVFEMADCQDRPYMMRIDHSETLRRGDAYARIGDVAVKLGRKQLQDLFEKKFRESVSAERIEIGFPGEIIHKHMSIRTTDLTGMPSAIASTKLKQLLDIQENAKNTGSTTVMARLTHARLFGSDSPYQNRSPADLIDEMAQIKRKHVDDDEHYLFEENGKKLQVVIYNQGDEPIRDASLSLVMPNHNSFYVATHLPKMQHNGKYIDRSAKEDAAYPSVRLKDDCVHVSSTIGDIPSGELAYAFEAPLRICAGEHLAGRRLGVRYSLFGANLRNPATGLLRLIL